MKTFSVKGIEPYEEENLSIGKAHLFIGSSGKPPVLEIGDCPAIILTTCKNKIRKTIEVSLKISKIHWKLENFDKLIQMEGVSYKKEILIFDNVSLLIYKYLPKIKLEFKFWKVSGEASPSSEFPPFFTASPSYLNWNGVPLVDGNELFEIEKIKKE